MDHTRPMVVGHRGAPVAAPENTMAAFLAARDLGAAAVELDVHLTADDVAVVHHDYALDRTTSGHGPIFDRTWDELAALDAGRRFDPRFTGEAIPRLSDVLAIDDLAFEVELKGYRPRAVDVVLGAVHEAGVLHRTEFTSSNGPLLSALAEREPDATTGLFTPAFEERWMTREIFHHIVLGHARETTHGFVHVDAAAITEGLVADLHRLDKSVLATGAHRADGVQRAAEAGADRISTDDVHMAVTILDVLADPR